MPVGIAAWAVLVVVGVDLAAMTRWGYGALALPIAVVLSAIVLATLVSAWVGLADRPDMTRGAVVKASLYLSVRGAGWSLLSLASFGALGAIVWAKPAIGLGLVLAPALYVVWGNSRRVLMSVLPTEDEVRDDGRPELARSVRVAR
jgi:hypothetical protein